MCACCPVYLQERFIEIDLFAVIYSIYYYLKFLASVLRKIRLVVAGVFYIAVTLLFLDFTGGIHKWLGWMARIQLVPAILDVNVVIIVGLVILTLVFGRIYCSVICPLGVMQDIIAWFGKKGRHLPYSYSKALSWVRYSFMALFIVAFFAGACSLVTLLEPYSTYGNIAGNLLQPIWKLCNNLLAFFAERINSYALYETSVWIKSGVALGVSVGMLIVIGIMAWRNGRTYCNTVCPVGTVLGWLSRYSLFRPVIDTDKCNGCSLCAKNCKASCINHKEHTIDYSRCVACMDCIENCRQHAISYRLRPKEGSKEKPSVKGVENIDGTRRGVIAGLGLLVSTATFAAGKKKVDGGLAVIFDKKAPVRDTRIVPPGAVSLRNLDKYCVGCQLCVSVCPNDVLRPSDEIDTFMHPVMSYERGYCRPECTKCSEVCPTLSIRKIDAAEKSAVQIGHAVWIKDNCLAASEGVKCDNCHAHCPTGAISMVVNKDNVSGPNIPVVNVERCIGCGACEYLCPARPFSAIYVEGLENHRTI